MTEPRLLRAGLAANLGRIPGLHVYPYVPAKAEPPAAIVNLGSITWDRAHNRGLDEYEFEVSLVVAAATDRSAQERLDELLASSGPTSVKAALEADTSLGGHAADLHVRNADTIREFTANDLTMIGCTVTVAVWAAG